MKTNLLVVFMCFVSVVWAGEVTLGTVAYGGSGCEPGTAELFLTSDKDSVHLVTPGYYSAGGDRKTCTLALPVQPAPGVKVAISAVRVDARKRSSENVIGAFQAELFMAGLHSPAMNLLFEGIMDKQEITVLEPEEDKLTWSGCGQSAILRVNSNLIIAEGSVQVASLRVRLKTKPC